MAHFDAAFVAIKGAASGVGNFMAGDARDLAAATQEAVAEAIRLLAETGGALRQDLPQVIADVRSASRSAAAAFDGPSGIVARTGPALDGFTANALPGYARLAQEARAHTHPRPHGRTHRPGSGPVPARRSRTGLPEMRSKPMWIAPARAGLKGAALLALTGCTTLGAFERAATPFDVYELRLPSAPRASAPRPCRRSTFPTHAGPARCMRRSRR